MEFTANVAFKVVSLLFQEQMQAMLQAALDAQRAEQRTAEQRYGRDAQRSPRPPA